MKARPGAEDQMTFGVPRTLSAGLGDVSLQLKQYSFTLLICIAIAILIWAGTPGLFTESLAFSLSIGLATHTLTIVGIYLFHPARMWKLWVVTVPIGVLVGLSVGAMINGMPLYNIFHGGSPIMSMVIALIASYVFYSYYSMIELRDQLRVEEINRVQSEKRLLETQLRLLQSQIEPHFLFNTLSHVVSLIRVDADRAEQMLHRLTQFLRASLRRSRSDHTSLQDELDLIGDYLGILKIRMGERLNYQFDIEVPPSAIQLPPLILQPLVENAVIHGLEPLEEGGRITLSVKESSGTLRLSVSDTGPGLGQGKGYSGVGLANVKDRLRILYGPAARLELTDGIPCGLVATVVIPIGDVDQ